MNRPARSVMPHARGAATLARLAWLNLARNKARTGLAAGAVALGVLALVVSGGFVQDVFIQLREVTIHSQLGHLQIRGPGGFGQVQGEAYRHVLAAPEGVIAQARTLPAVADVMLRVGFTGLASNGRADLPIVGEGVEPGKEATLGSALVITEGRQLQDDDRFGALLGKGLARSLGLGPGDFVTLVVSTPEGALNSLEFRVVGLFQSFAKEYDDRGVRVPLDAARELLATDAVHVAVVSLRRTDATDATLGSLRGLFAGTGLEVKPWYELADFYQKTVDLYDRQFAVLRIIILVMVILAVSNSVNLTVFERTAEFGTMRALGNRSRHVFALVLAETLLLGALGACIGVAAGVVIALAASAIGIPMPPPPNSDLGYTAEIRLVPSVIVGAFLIGIASTAVAGILPALRITRLPVVDALRHAR